MKRIILFLVAVQAIYSDSCENVFTEIWRNHSWKGISLSGTGSDLIQTEVIRKAIPSLLQKYKCKSMIDAPCGDFYWMQAVDLQIEKYIGVDVVRPLIQDNQSRFGNHQRSFLYLDIINQVLPKADLIFCRDCLVHFCYSDIVKAIKMFKQSGSTYLLTTSFTEDHAALNSVITTGEWRPLDLRLEPFYFPPPIEIINESCTEVTENPWPDKCLFLWKIEDLPDF